jgi:hypothetical protein
LDVLCRGSANLVDYFAPYSQSSDEAIDSMLDSNSAMTWALRLLSFILSFCGILCFFQPIQEIADAANDILSFFSCIPILGWGLDFLGNVVAGAVGCALSFIALGVSFPTTLLVMAIMWTAMRPLLAVPALGLGVIGLFMTIRHICALAEAGKQLKHNKRL